MAGREARAGDSKPPVLRIAEDEAERRAPVATVVERPEARGRSEVDPMFSVAFRAFLLDLGILGTSITLYITVMINSGYLFDEVETPLTGAAMIVWWVLLILLRGGYEARYLGVGNEEFKRCRERRRSRMLAAIAIAAYVAKSAPPLRLVLSLAGDRHDARPAGPVVAARLVGPPAPPGAVPAEHADRRRPAAQRRPVRGLRDRRRSRGSR